MTCVRRLLLSAAMRNYFPRKKCRSAGEYSRNIRQVARHMSSMLNSLLGFFRLESGGEKAVPVPVQVMFRHRDFGNGFYAAGGRKNLLLNVLSAGMRLL